MLHARMNPVLVHFRGATHPFRKGMRHILGADGGPLLEEELLNFGSESLLMKDASLEHLLGRHLNFKVFIRYYK